MARVGGGGSRGTCMPYGLGLWRGGGPCITFSLLQPLPATTPPPPLVPSPPGSPQAPAVSGDEEARGLCLAALEGLAALQYLAISGPPPAPARLEGVGGAVQQLLHAHHLAPLMQQQYAMAGEWTAGGGGYLSIAICVVVGISITFFVVPGLSGLS